MFQEVQQTKPAPQWSRQELQERVRPTTSSIGLHLANIPAHVGVSPR
eukprot:SAG22_NODE_11461_length_484_cov_0.740260_2_plen_46_part_01